MPEPKAPVGIEGPYSVRPEDVIGLLKEALKDLRSGAYRKIPETEEDEVRMREIEKKEEEMAGAGEGGPLPLEFRSWASEDPEDSEAFSRALKDEIGPWDQRILALEHALKQEDALEAFQLAALEDDWDLDNPEVEAVLKSRNPREAIQHLLDKMNVLILAERSAAPGEAVMELKAQGKIESEVYQAIIEKTRDILLEAEGEEGSRDAGDLFYRERESDIFDVIIKESEKEREERWAEKRRLKEKLIGALRRREAAAKRGKGRPSRFVGEGETMAEEAEELEA